MLSRLILKYFVWKKYKIEFHKRSVRKNNQWYTMRDTFAMQTLRDLQEKYRFEILQMDLKSYTCTVTIRCHKNDRLKIFTDFCSEIGEYIENVNMK